jgi:hypothetical protein
MQTYLGVGDGREGGVDAGRLGGHGEEGGDAEGDPGRHCALVQPEADPRHDDQHAAGDVDLDQVVRELPLEQQVHLQATVLACARARKTKEFRLAKWREIQNLRRKVHQCWFCCCSNQ